jgi:hypothetical protein
MAATAQAAALQTAPLQTAPLETALRQQSAQPLTDPGDAQLALYDRPRAHARIGRPGPEAPRCAGCREKEARYGFRNDDDPIAARPRTLCFECFRVEIGRRQAVAAQLARGWNAEQVGLPLEEKLEALSLRRRRAQIAARHALGL